MIEMRRCNITKTLHGDGSHSTKGARTKVALTETADGLECALSVEIELSAPAPSSISFHIQPPCPIGGNHEQYGRRQYGYQEIRAE
jgi:hypothetical protein